MELKLGQDVTKKITVTFDKHDIIVSPKDLAGMTREEYEDMMGTNDPEPICPQCPYGQTKDTCEYFNDSYNIDEDCLWTK